jgi:hypothetical protein
MMTAYTEDIDEINEAVADILGQIDLTALKRNTVGFIVCYYDFIESGMVKALCEKLPFDVIGMTSMASGSNGGFGMYTLRLTVLTSDDVEFAAAMTPPLTREQYAETIARVYEEASAPRNPRSPSLIISCIPQMNTIAGADITKRLDEACGGVPIWGSVTSGVDMRYEECHAIYNGDAAHESLAMLLFYGNIHPEFVVTSIPERNIRETRGIVTESCGCVLKTVNNLPIIKYLEQYGIVLRPENSTTTPLLVYYNDAEPVALGIYTINEDGSAIFGGEIPVGASVAIAEIDREGIIETARRSMEKIRAIKETHADGILLLPCVTRYIMLSPDQEEEMRLVSDFFAKEFGNITGDAPPFLLGYSGGEICPVKEGDGKYHNRFHNYTFSALIL